MMNSKKCSLLLTLTLLMGTLMVSSAYIVAPASAQAASDWPMFHYNPARSGFNPTSTAPYPFNYGWMYQTGGPVRSSPAVVGGKVYVGSSDNYVYCLDADDGSLIWRYETGNAVHSSPAVVDGKVYVGSSDNYVYCLDADDGSLVWKYKTGYFVDSAPCVVDGKVYVTSNDKEIYCLDADDGSLVWNFTTRGYDGFLPDIPGDVTIQYYSSSPAVVGGKVYVGSFDNYVYCLDADDGSLIWEFRGGIAPLGAFPLAGGFWECTPTVANDIVYIGGFDHYMYALNANTGNLVWKVKYSDLVIDGYDWWIQTSPAFAYDKLYVNWASHTTIAHDPETGALIWKSFMGHICRSSPAIADGRVYSFNNDRYIYSFDAETGERLQSEPTPNSFLSSPAIADGKVFIGNNDGKVYCYVEGSMQSQSIFSLMVQARTIPLGQSATVSGFLNVIRGFGPTGATMILVYTKPDATTVTRTVTTGDFSAFTDTYTPDAEGVWSVKASWLGTEWELPSESLTEKFTVTAAEPVATTITVGLDLPTSLPSGETQWTRGAIAPAASGATVTLTYTKPDATTTTRTATTGTDGSYEDSYAPDTAGRWSVKASWTGSGTHIGSTSAPAFFFVTEVVVVEEGEEVEYIYAIVAVIAIAITAIVAYWYMKRPK